MKSFPAKNLYVLVFALVGIASRSEASIITVPIGLAPGSQYRLVFITVGEFAPLSSLISTYNNDVATEVAAIPELAALGATWSAIAATETVSAAANIGASPASVSIYLLDGLTRVADGTGTFGTGLFSGSILAPIGMTDSGVPLNNFAPWTGANPDGSSVIGAALGEGTLTLGNAFSKDGGWIDFESTTSHDLIGPLYGISSVLTVPSLPTPEPASIALTALGVLFLLLVQRSRELRPKPPSHPRSSWR